VPTPRTAERTFVSATSSVREARRFMTSCLETWDMSSLVWTAQLLLGELATNAVLHAAEASFTVTVSQLPDSSLRLEVHDGSTRPPRLRDYGTSSTTGRGVALVAQLSRGWGVTPSGTGKVVWCEIVSDDGSGGSLDVPEPEQESDFDLDAFLADVDLPDHPERRAHEARGWAA
jgi:anti-sigma regulatory factor (Ser/Thr protein kinase)